MGIKNREAMVSDSRGYSKIVLQTKAHNGLKYLRKKQVEFVLKPLTFTFLYTHKFTVTQNLFTSFIENFLSGFAYVYNDWKLYTSPTMSQSRATKYECRLRTTSTTT